jgi:hypothetical protein
MSSFKCLPKKHKPVDNQEAIHVYSMTCIGSRKMGFSFNESLIVPQKSAIKVESS